MEKDKRRYSALRTVYISTSLVPSEERTQYSSTSDSDHIVNSLVEGCTPVLGQYSTLFMSRSHEPNTEI